MWAISRCPARRPDRAGAARGDHECGTAGTRWTPRCRGVDARRAASLERGVPWGRWRLGEAPHLLLRRRRAPRRTRRRRRWWTRCGDAAPGVR